MLAFPLLVSAAQSQESMTIGIIDFYGLRTLTEDAVRAVLPFKEGDPATPHDPAMELEIAKALDVSRVKIDVTCCPEPGVVIIYVGVEETPMPGLAYHAPPTGDAALPPEILETAAELEAVSMASIRDGDSREDWSEGHALAMNPAVRALQERYLVYAEQHRDALVEVLHNSDDGEQRAVAATVIGYASDKQTVIPELEQAVLDSSYNVRNNAIRALGLMALYANEHPELGLEIRPDPYIDMLNSVLHTDRNKASLILFFLTSSRDPELLAQLEEQSLLSLIEMCRWKAEEHAGLNCTILERVVGLPEQDEPHPKETTIALAVTLLASAAAGGVAETAPDDPIP